MNRLKRRLARLEARTPDGPKPIALPFPPDGLSEEEIAEGLAYWEARGPMTEEEFEAAYCVEPHLQPKAPFYTHDVEAARELARDYMAGKVPRWAPPEARR